ncbi:NUDIX domain-containing protein [Streptococcus parauberis]|uniref:NUDIX domain-containing protein n=1 Tax=Streptococcus parauberis TaxID=1348 RepID=A0AAE4HTW7_9STRE|nr:NUDIX domain-containing protein [Streptococcus parauberis]MDT2731240.1 NUDIX domain-containing protein [Streptococcus parauberis]
MEVRSSVLLVRNREIFLVEQDDMFYTISGALLFGETSVEAVSRETKEKIGIQVNNLQLAFIVENHFKIKQQLWHNIEVHYIVNSYMEPPLQMNESGRIRQCKWVAFDELKNINLVPEFLKTELPN